MNKKRSIQNTIRRAERVIVKAARFVSFCFFAGGYEGEIYRARADNARLE